MMTTGKILRYTGILGVCCILIVCGCPQPQQPVPSAGAAGVLKSSAVKIELKPTAGTQTTYRITNQRRRNIKWEGPVPEKSEFEESANDEKVEMVVTQQIQSVDPNGQVVARVTFDSLKYNAVVKNVTTVDFDSSRQADANNVLNKLIGKSYTVEFNPDNTVARVSGLDILQQMFSSKTYNDRAAKSILLADTIMERHSMLLLPQTGAGSVKPGGTWSRLKTFPFGMMGIKSYEKIYKLEKVRDENGRQVAVIDMNAIPSAEVESKYRGQQASGTFPNMFDTDDVYAGSGEVDLTAGVINKYSENLHSAWMAAMPANPGEANDLNVPVVLKMTATRQYNIEMVK